MHTSTRPIPRYIRRRSPPSHLTPAFLIFHLTKIYQCQLLAVTNMHSHWPTETDVAHAMPFVYRSNWLGQPVFKVGRRRSVHPVHLMHLVHQSISCIGPSCPSAHLSSPSASSLQVVSLSIIGLSLDHPLIFHSSIRLLVLSLCLQFSLSRSLSAQALLAHSSTSFMPCQTYCIIPSASRIRPCLAP